MRIRLEADAVQMILIHVRSQDLTLVISPAHRVEKAANLDPARRQHMESLIAEIGTDTDLDFGQARRRAMSLLNKGLKPADAAHAALAEEAGLPSSPWMIVCCAAPAGSHDGMVRESGCLL